MGVLTQIGQILFILSVLVVLHELGHYLAARLFGVRAEKFYLFMDPGFSLFKKKIGPTEWGIGWLPLGGYVKLAGMMDESMDKEQMKEPPKPDEYRSKPAWQRLIILLGGIIVNILVAIVIYTAIFGTMGKSYPSTEKYQKDGLSFTEVGQKIGFQNGDKIVSIDGKTQARFDRMVIDILLGEEILVDRNGEEVKIQLTDENIKDILGNEGRGFVQPRIPAILDTVLSTDNAYEAGIRNKDKVVSVAGQAISFYDELSPLIEKERMKDSIAGEKAMVDIVVSRDGLPKNIKVPIDENGKIGVMAFPNAEDFFVTEKMNVGNAFVHALEESYTMMVYNVKQFKLILKPKTEAYKQVSSPVKITTMMPKTWDWEFVWKFMAFFSIALAFMNLLPIPGLDGGHALITTIEMVTGKKMNEKTAGIVQTIGMVLLLSLMAVTIGKDILNLITG